MKKRENSLNFYALLVE